MIERSGLARPVAATLFWSFNPFNPPPPPLTVPFVSSTVCFVVRSTVGVLFFLIVVLAEQHLADPTPLSKSYRRQESEHSSSSSDESLSPFYKKGHTRDASISSKSSYSTTSSYPNSTSTFGVHARGRGGQRGGGGGRGYNLRRSNSSDSSVDSFSDYNVVTGQHRRRGGGEGKSAAGASAAVEEEGEEESNSQNRHLDSWDSSLAGSAISVGVQPPAAAAAAAAAVRVDDRIGASAYHELLAHSSGGDKTHRDGKEEEDSDDDGVDEGEIKRRMVMQKH